VEPLEIRVDDLLLRSWRPTDVEDIVRARDDALGLARIATDRSTEVAA
jgi:hypothetical protein